MKQLDEKLIWTMLRVFYGKEPVKTATLSREDMEIIEKSCNAGGSHRPVAFSKGKSSIGLTASGKELLARFIFKASYLQNR